MARAYRSIGTSVVRGGMDMEGTDVIDTPDVPAPPGIPVGIARQLWRLLLVVLKVVRALWRRLPVVVTAVLTGLTLSAVGTGVSGLLLLANIKLAPSAPWSVPIGAAWLWLYWRYVGGWGWPRSTAQSRRERRRTSPLSKQAWRWSLWAGGLTIAALLALMRVTERFGDVVPYSGEWLFKAAPAHTLLPLLLLGSLSAGLVEESAFRGYMQVAIERRHGPVAGIVIVAVVFTLAHLGTFPQMSLGFFLQFATMCALGFGLLAYVSGSILPGVILHAAGDALGFVAAVLLGRGDRIPRFSETGPDRFLAVECLNLVVLATLAILAYRRLLAVKRGERACALQG